MLLIMPPSSRPAAAHLPGSPALSPDPHLERIPAHVDPLDQELDYARLFGRK
jgi:hypothetical protein